MKAAIVLSFAAAVMAKCNADNCARQVTGTRPGLTPIESRKADCSSFMTQTETPDAVTTTVTITVDEDDEPTQDKREVDARAAETEGPTVPAYASGCDTNERYSSICECAWDITESITTAPTPTETKTVTETIDYCEDL